jgi:chorismate dehydratase
MIHRVEHPDPYRIGAVSFLNSVPLIEGLREQRDVALSLDLPARLADALFEDRIDVGLIPVVEYLRGVGGPIVPGICIASHGPVHTVRVFSKVALPEATSIAVDRASRTSVALLRVLLAELYGCQPDMHVAKPRPEALFEHHETVLVIGDRATQVDATGLHDYDLGEMWRELTGLPFVYAAWVLSTELTEAPGAAARAELVTRLREAKARGLAQLHALAERESATRGLGTAWIESYWRDAMHYDLGEAELAGLARFAELAAKHNLCVGREAFSLAEA